MYSGTRVFRVTITFGSPATLAQRGVFTSKTSFANQEVCSPPQPATLINAYAVAIMTIKPTAVSDSYPTTTWIQTAPHCSDRLQLNFCYHEAERCPRIVTSWCAALRNYKRWMSQSIHFTRRSWDGLDRDRKKVEYEKADSAKGTTIDSFIMTITSTNFIV